MENNTDKLISFLNERVMSGEYYQNLYPEEMNCYKNLIMLINYDHQYSYYWRICLMQIIHEDWLDFLSYE